MMSLADDRFDDFDDENEDDNMAKRRSGSSFGSFRGSIGKIYFAFSMFVFEINYYIFEMKHDWIYRLSSLLEVLDLHMCYLLLIF